jgi:hypothetical protein
MAFHATDHLSPKSEIQPLITEGPGLKTLIVTEN